jgi:predicted esterase YcpF (UPF0227 family)
MILYLHGFRSAPASTKARLLQEKMQSIGRSAQWLCPQLPPSPKQAMALIESLIEQHKTDSLRLIGSSLGGFYADLVARKYDLPCVLLNPASFPSRDLAPYIGSISAFHSQDKFDFLPDYLDELAQLEQQRESLGPASTCMMIAAKGDEVLDWREMLEQHPYAQTMLLEGSDHGIQEFADYLDQVLAFCDRSGSLG